MSNDMLALVCDRSPDGTSLGNLLGRPPVGGDFPPEQPFTFVISSEDPDFPKELIFDDRSDVVYRAASAVSNLNFTKDVNLVHGPTVWTIIEFDVAVAAGWIDDGVISGFQTYHQDIWVRSGERLQLLGSLSGQGSEGGPIPSTITVQNLRNGNYLQPNGADVHDAPQDFTLISLNTTVFYNPTDLLWDPANNPCISGSMLGTGTDTESYSVQFNVENVDDCHGYFWVPLRITLRTHTGASHPIQNFNLVLLLPQVNFAGMYGYNLGAIAEQLQFAPDTLVADYYSSSPTYVLADTFKIIQPIMYVNFDPVSTRYWPRWWKFLSQGTNYEAIYLAEAVLGFATSPTKSQSWGWPEDEEVIQLRQETAAKQTWAYAQVSGPMRTLTLDFLPDAQVPNDEDMAALESIRQELYQRSKGGVFPIWLVPRLGRKAVVMGRIAETPLSVQQTEPNMQTIRGLMIKPFPPPIVGA